MTNEEVIRRQDVLDLAKKGILISNGSYKSVCKAINEIPPVNPTEPCKDAIDRAKAMTEIMMFAGNVKPDEEDIYIKVSDAVQLLRDLPPVNPTKVGHWIEIAQYSDGNHKIECSECESHIFDRGHANSFNVKNKYKYCPNCGARMVEPQEI